MTSEEGGRVEVGGRGSFPTASLKQGHANRTPAEPNGPNPFAGGEKRFAPTNPPKNAQNLRLHFGTFFGKKCISRPIRKKVNRKRECLLRFLPSFSAFKNWFFFRAKTGQFFDHAPFAGASTNLCWKVGSCRLGNLLRPENCVAALHVQCRRVPNAGRPAPCLGPQCEHCSLLQVFAIACCDRSA